MDTLVEICENPYNFFARPLTFFCGCARIRGPRSQGYERIWSTKTEDSEDKRGLI